MNAGRRARRLVALAAGLVVGLPAIARAQNTECEAGDREVRALEFRGNTLFRASDLALRVATTSSDLTRRSLRIIGEKRCLDSDELRLDVGRLRIFYRHHGYFSTTVDTVVTTATDGLGGVRVAFIIREGEPVHVDTLRISGLDSAIGAIVDTSNLELHRGIVFDINRIQAAIDTMKARLRDNGYPRGDVVVAPSPVDTVARRVSLKLDVVPGTRARIGTMRVIDEPVPGSARHLSDATILRILGVKTGALYRERELLDGQRRLYQSDLFLHVDVKTVADTTQRSDSLVAVNVTVGENYLKQVDTEEGWAVLDCFKARAQYVDKNFLGDGRRLELTGQVSKVGWGEPTQFAGGRLCRHEIQQDVFSDTINYYIGGALRLPTLFGLPTSPSLSIYRERRSEYQAYLRTTFIGGETSVTVEPAKGIPVRLAYTLEYGHTDAQPALLCAIFQRCDAASRTQITDTTRALAVASAHLERIRLDDPYNPRSGTAFRLDARTALKEIGSDAKSQFYKGLVDASAYRPLGRPITLSARVRLGAVLSRGLALSDTGFIPPEERLYAGGANSVRGFQQNQLGDLIYISENAPNCRTTAAVPATPTSCAATTLQEGVVYYIDVPTNAGVRTVVPIGGNSLIVGNFEARIRSPYYPEFLQFALFTDAGDVWQRNLGGVDHKASDLWLNGLKWTPGFGIRLVTPVGPFQANVAYNTYSQPNGSIYFDAAPDASGFAPLYCVSPGNTIPATYTQSTNRLEQASGTTISCTPNFVKSQSTNFFSHLTFTFSIGPDF